MTKVPDAVKEITNPFEVQTKERSGRPIEHAGERNTVDMQADRTSRSSAHQKSLQGYGLKIGSLDRQTDRTPYVAAHNSPFAPWLFLMLRSPRMSTRLFRYFHLSLFPLIRPLFSFSRSSPFLFLSFFYFISPSLHLSFSFSNSSVFQFFPPFSLLCSF